MIESLKNLSLDSYPVQQIAEAISLFKDEEFITFSLKPGQEIFRIRPNLPNQRYYSKSELTYKPLSSNASYLRANTPDFTMFYGWILPNSLIENIFDNGQIIENIEASNLIRESSDNGCQLITFSRWVVTDYIPLVTICFKKQMSNEYLNENGICIEKEFANYSQKTLDFTHFMAFEFAQKDNDKEYNYLISALFTKFILNNGYGGVVFPNVRAERQGFKVAITPEYVDTSIKLKTAGECLMYKQDNKIFVDNETISFIEDDSASFEYNLVPKEYHLGEEKINALFDNINKCEKKEPIFNITINQHL